MKLISSGLKSKNVVVACIMDHNVSLVNFKRIENITQIEQLNKFTILGYRIEMPIRIDFIQIKTGFFVRRLNGSVHLHIPVPTMFPKIIPLLTFCSSNRLNFRAEWNHHVSPTSEFGQS